MLVANILNCAIALASITLIIRRTFMRKQQLRQHLQQQQLPEGPPPAVSVVVACYLPNEQAIIESTIEHIMRRLEWPGPLTLYIVYNTPAPLPFEQILKRLDGRVYSSGRRLRVRKVDGSTSKAENLNYIIPTIEVCVSRCVCAGHCSSAALASDAGACGGGLATLHLPHVSACCSSVCRTST